MSSTRTGQNIDPQPIPDAEARTVPRPKTAATRLSVEELEEVESAANGMASRRLNGYAIPFCGRRGSDQPPRSNWFWQSFLPTAPSPIRSPNK